MSRLLYLRILQRRLADPGADRKRGAYPLSTMRDAGLQEAIRAVGSLTELARRIGISQPSVSNWDRVPAERVVTVERVSGVARTVLRPDLYSQAPAPGIDETDIARAQEYLLLSRLLRCAPDAALFDRLARLSGGASPLGRAHASLAEAASRAKVESVIAPHEPTMTPRLRLLARIQPSAANGSSTAR